MEEEEDPFGSPQALVLYSPTEAEHPPPRLLLERGGDAAVMSLTSRPRTGSAASRPRRSVANETVNFEALAAATVNSYLLTDHVSSARLDGSGKGKTAAASMRRQSLSPSLGVETVETPQYSPRSTFLATAGIRRDQPGYRRRSTLLGSRMDVSPAASSLLVEREAPQGEDTGPPTTELLRRRGTAAQRKKQQQRHKKESTATVVPLVPEDIRTPASHVTVPPSPTGSHLQLPPLASARSRLPLSAAGGEQDEYRLRYGVDLSLYPASQRALWLIPGTNKLRLLFFRVVMSPLFQYAILVVILLNAVLIAANQPRYPLSFAVKRAFWVADCVFVALFITEALMKIVALGFVLHRRSYLRSYWNVMDFIILVISIITTYGYLSTSSFSMVRLLRIVRPLRTIGHRGELRRLLSSLLRAAPQVINNGLLLVFIMALFAISAVYLWTGLLDRRCYAEYFPNASVGANAAYYGNLSFPAIAFESPPCGGRGLCQEYAGLVARGTGEPIEITCGTHTDIYAKRFMNYNNIGTALFLLFKVVTLDNWASDMSQAVAISGRLAAAYFVLLTLVASFFCLNLFVAILTNSYVLSGDDPNSQDEGWDFGAFDDERPTLNNGGDETAGRGLKGDRGEDHYMRRVFDLKVDAATQTAPLLIEVDERPLQTRVAARQEASAAEDQQSVLTMVEWSMATSVLALRNVNRQIPVALMYRLDPSTLDRPFKDAPVAVEPPEPRPTLVETSIEPPPGDDGGKFVETVTQSGLFEAIALFERTMGSQCQVAKEDAQCPRRTWQVHLGNVVEGTPVCVFMFLVVLANVGSVSVDHYGQSNLTSSVLFYIRLVSTAILALQISLKALAFGLVRTFRRHWNAFDALIILVSFPDLFERQTSTLAPFAMARALRAVRVIRILQGFRTFQAIANTLVDIWRTIALLLVLISMVLVVYACVGMELFGLDYEHKFLDPTPNNLDEVLGAGTGVLGAPPKDNFGSLAEALLLCFVVITGDQWTYKMRVAMEGGPFNEAMGLLFFTTLLFIGKFVLINLFVATIIDKLAERMEDAQVAEDIMPPLMLPPLGGPEVTDASITASVNKSATGGTKGLDHDGHWDTLLHGLGVAAVGHVGARAAGTVPLTEDEIIDRRRQREANALERAKLRALLQSELYHAAPYEGRLGEVLGEAGLSSGKSSTVPAVASPLVHRSSTLVSQSPEDGWRVTPVKSYSTKEAPSGAVSAQAQAPPAPWAGKGKLRLLRDYLTANANYQIKGDSLYLFSPHGTLRRFLTYVLGSMLFHIVMLVVVVVRTAFLCFEARSNSDDTKRLLDRASFVFTAIFFCEMVMKITAFGLVYPAPPAEAISEGVTNPTTTHPQAEGGGTSPGSSSLNKAAGPGTLEEGTLVEDHNITGRTGGEHQVPGAFPRRTRPWFRSVKRMLRERRDRADVGAVSPEEGDWKEVIAQARTGRTGADETGKSLGTPSAGDGGYEPAYLRVPWNWADFIVNGLAMAALFVPIFRLGRVLRIIRLIVHFDRTRVVLESLMFSTPQLLQGVAFGAIVFFVLGVMGVQLYKGQFYACNDATVLTRDACVGLYNRSNHGVLLPSEIVEFNVPRAWERNAYHFDHLGASVLSLFVMAVGEKWTQVMFLAMNTTSDPADGTGGAAGGRPYMAIFFVVSVVCCNFLAFNTVIGILVSYYAHGKRYLDGSALLSPAQRRYAKTKYLIASILTHDELVPRDEPYAYRVDTFLQSRTFAGMVGPSPWQVSSPPPTVVLPRRAASPDEQPMSIPTLMVEPTPSRAVTAGVSNSRFFKRKRVGGGQSINPLVAPSAEAKDEEMSPVADSPAAVVSPSRSRRRRKAIIDGSQGVHPSPAGDDGHRTLSVRDRDPNAVPVFENIMYGATLVNAGFILSSHRDMPDTWLFAIYCANALGLLMLVGELAANVLAYGWLQYASLGWHQVDIFVILVSCAQYPVEGVLGYGFVAYFPVVRLLRLGRRRRVMKLLDVARRSFDSFSNVLALLTLVFLAYAVAGVILFGDVKRNGSFTDETNFDNVPNALLLLYQASTTVGWTGYMTAAGLSEPDCSEAVGNCGSVSQATAYFVSLMVFLTFTVLQLFVAVIVEVFVDQIDPSDPSVYPLFHLQRQWAEIIGVGVSSISADQFVRLAPQLSLQLTGIDRRGYYFGVGTGVRGEFVRMLATLHIPLDSRMCVRYSDVVQAFGWRLHSVESTTNVNINSTIAGHRSTFNAPPRTAHTLTQILLEGTTLLPALGNERFLVSEYHAAVVVQRRWRAYQMLSDRQHVAVLRHPKRVRRAGGVRGPNRKGAISHYFVHATGATGLKLDMEEAAGGEAADPVSAALQDPFADTGGGLLAPPLGSTGRGLTGQQTLLGNSTTQQPSRGQVPHGTLRIPGTSLLAFQARTLVPPPSHH